MEMGLNSSFLPDNILNCMSQADKKPLGKSGLTRKEIEAKAEVKSEKELQSSIVAYLKLKEIVVCSPTFGKVSRIKKGWPDLTFCYKGIPCLWEIKRPKGILSEDQKQLHYKLIDNGWSVKVIRSIEEAKQTLEEITSL